MTHLPEPPQYPQRPYLPSRPGAQRGPVCPDVEPPRVGRVAAAQVAEGNLLLRRLPEHEYAQLLPSLERSELRSPAVLVEAGAPLTHGYFPGTGVVSVVRRMSDGRVVETGAVGREGMAGVAVVFGSQWTSSTIQAQVPGTCTRIRLAALRDAVADLPTLRDVLQRCAHAFLDRVGHTLACNSLHAIEQRYARWLLLTQDGVGADELRVTHGLVADMLAVRRASVTEVAGAFHRAGLIRHVYGKVTVVDRAGLEAAACECYGVIRQSHDRIMGEAPLARPAVGLSS